ncbi:MAG: hypothetical protein WC243_01270 [Patescibacteria group bacterium]|jgi:hypothetical protein
MLMTPAKKRILVAFSSLLLVLGLVLFVSDRFFTDYSTNDNPPIANDVVPEVYYEGVITYISSSLYPDDKIGYSLTDASGKQIILLKARDEMLVVSEGLTARVYGKVSNTKDGKSKVLLVERVVINNGSN